jgi:hypothetical protein
MLVAKRGVDRLELGAVERALDAARTRTALNTPAKRLMRARVELKALEAEAI